MDELELARFRFGQLCAFLSRASARDLNHFLMSVDVNEPKLDCLKSVEDLFVMLDEKGEKISSDNVPDNLYFLLVRVLDIKKTRDSRVYAIITLLTKWYAESLWKLIERNLSHSLAKILEKELRLADENRLEEEDLSDATTTLHLISSLLPVLPRSPCYLEVDDYVDGILFSGCRYNVNDNKIRQNVRSVLRPVFRTVYGTRSRGRCPPTLGVLLLKMVFWASALDALESYLAIEVIAYYVNTFLKSQTLENVVIGTAFMHTLIPTFLLISDKMIDQEALRNARSVVDSRSNGGENRWMIEFYDFFSHGKSYEVQRQLEMIKYCFSNEICRASIHHRSNLVSSMLWFIMPHLRHKTDADHDLNLCYSRLYAFVESFLELPKNCIRHKGELKVQLEGIKNFESLVSFVVCTINDMSSLGVDSYKFVINLNKNDLFHDLIEPASISLGLFRSPSLSAVLGVSKYQVELRSNQTSQALRLLSILHAVNENWGVLFCTLIRDRLIEIRCFRSVRFESMIAEQLKSYIAGSIDGINLQEDFISSYPFLFSFALRKNVFQHLVSRRHGVRRDRVDVVVPRRNIIEFLERPEILHRFDRSHHVPSFKFEGEIGSGDGPTKEFYSKFSQECQRHDLNVWIGEATRGAYDLLYSSSPCGLFPLPTCSARESTLKLIGVFMSKAIIDGYQLDIPFSPAFYKLLFSPHSQPLILNDIIDVTPNIFNFVKGLVEALKERHNIKTDGNLAPEEMLKAISSITCDGSSFEDLCVYFTVPGFSDFEMVDGGSDIQLTVDNLKEYLMMLTFWLLYFGPQKAIEQIRASFNNFLPSTHMRLLYPEEIGQLLCGITEEQWTVDYLKKCCKLQDGLTVNAPCVQNLFEILSSLSPSDQRLFLQFVTSSPRLPAGGLKYLDPPLTIGHSGSETSLPTSMTCFNVLFVNSSVGKEVLEERLLTAIREGADSFHIA